MAYRYAIVAIAALLLIVGYLAVNMLYGWNGLAWLEPDRDERLHAAAFQFGQGTPREVSTGLTLSTVTVSDGGLQFLYEFACELEECADQDTVRGNFYESSRSYACKSPQLKSLLRMEAAFVEFVYVDASGNIITSFRVDLAMCPTDA